MSDPEVISSKSRKFPQKGETGKPSGIPHGQPTPTPQTPIKQAPTTVSKESFPEKTEPVVLAPDETVFFFPSQGEFYDVSSVPIKRMKGFHQAKFHMAAKTKKDRFTVEAVGTLLGGGVDAFNLTIQDFYAILYWLRLNTYLKTELTHNGVCDNPDHIHEVATRKKPPESLRTLVVISKTSIKQTDLETNYLEGFEESARILSETLEPLGYSLSAPRMFDVVDLNELFGDEPNYQEIAYLADRAACIARTDGERSPLRTRIQVVENLDVGVLEMLEEWRIRCSSYGVIESTRFKCKGCGADVENEISISAHSFL